MTDFTPPPPIDLSAHRRSLGRDTPTPRRVTIAPPPHLVTPAPGLSPGDAAAEVERARRALTNGATYLAFISRDRAGAARFLRETADDLDPPAAEVEAILAAADPRDIA